MARSRLPPTPAAPVRPASLPELQVSGLTPVTPGRGAQHPRRMRLATSLVNHAISPQTFRDRFIYYLRYVRGLELNQATPADQLAALQLTIRETLIDRAVATQHAAGTQSP